MPFISKVMAVIVALFLGVGYLAYDYFYKEVEPSLDNLEQSERLSLKKNIVVMGVDERSGDTGRSDTLFVVMFDPKNKNASLLSIPRDTMVKIPRHGWDKVNHAYAYGGEKMTRQTVEEFLGIRINNYVLIDTKGFPGIVDAIGGVDIDVDEDMHYSDPYDDNGGLVINIAKGKQHMDGAKAIQYVRYRDEQGDIGRIKRQQKFIAAMYDKVVSAQILVKIPGILKEITSLIKTDLDMTDMASIAKALYDQSKTSGGLQMATVPGEPAYIEDISYWIPDMTDLRAEMVKMQGATMSSKYRAAAERYESEYHKLVPGAGDNDKKDNKDKKIIIKKIDNPDLLKAVEVAKETEKKAGDKGKKKEDSAVKGNSVGEKKPVQPQENTPKAQESNANRPIKVNIINCSGRPEDLATVIAAARAQGFQVMGTSTGNTIASTQIVSTTNNGKIVERLGSLPFRYALRIALNPSAGIDGTIYIGEDFR